MVYSISFQTFCTGIQNYRRLLKIQYVIAIHLMRWQTNFYHFTFKWTATAAIGIHPTKMPQKRMECFRLLFDHLAWIEYQFLSGIRDLRKPGSLWGIMRGVGGVKKSIHHGWLAEGLGLGLGLLCWGFKGVQEQIPSQEASTLQIGSVAFPPGQYTSPQLHLCHRLFDQDGHQDSSSPSL